MILILLLLLAFFLRTYRLDSQALRGDEAATVLYSALPITDLWELSRVTDPHPPLYYLLLHPWQWLAGESAWAMRFAGVAASTLAVAALATLAWRTLRSTRIALAAAGLLTINPLQIWLAQDIRSYPFFTLLGLLSSAALWWALNGGWQGAGGKWQVAGGTLQVAGGKSQVAGGKSQVAGGRSQVAGGKSQVAGGKGQVAGGRQQQTVRKTDHPLPASRSPLYAPRSPLLPWLSYIFLTVACFYIHYYTVFLIAFQGLFVLLNWPQFWPFRWPWLISQLAIALLIGPGLQLASNFIGPAAGGIDTIPLPAILQRTSTALLTGFTITDHWGGWLSLLLAPVWLIGLVVLWRHNFTSGSFWTLFFAVPVLGVVVLSIDRPFFKERFFIQAQPAFELLLAAGFLALGQIDAWANGRTRRATGANERIANGRIANKRYDSSPLPALRFIAAGLFAALLLSNLWAFVNYQTDPVYAKAPPWQLYRNLVSREARPGDVMLTNFPEAAVSYYSPAGLPFYVVPAERDRPVEFRIEQTEAIANAYHRIWFLPLLRQGFDEQGDVLNWLDRHGDRIRQLFLPGYHLNLYLTPPAIEALLIDQPATFAHGIRLRGFQILDPTGKSRLHQVDSEWVLTLEPQEEFTLSLYWQADGPTETPYTVFTHLIAADGFYRTGRDNQPVWGSYPTTAWQPGERVTDKYSLTLPPGTPPGDHRLRLGWYQSDTQQVVPVLDANGQPVGEEVILNVVIGVE